MPKTNSEQTQKKRTIFEWHRQIGLIISLLVILLAITGLLLNHTETLELDSSYVESERLLNWYGIKKPVITSYQAEQNWISHVGDKIYFNQLQVAQEVASLTGAVALKSFIVVASGDGLLLLTDKGEKIESLDATTGVPNNMISIGIRDSDHLVIRTKTGIVQTDKDFTTWEAAKGKSTATTWAHASTLPEDLKQSLNKLFRGEGLTTERVLLDLHSGRLLGAYGPLLMDTAAILFMVLSCTGCWMYARHSLVLYQRKRILAAAATGDAYSAADLGIGEEGVILTVVGDEPLRQRLAAMGVIAGTVITAPLTSVFGNPRTYNVRGYQLCMRTEEAMMIVLQTEAQSTHKLQKYSNPGQSNRAA